MTTPKTAPMQPCPLCGRPPGQKVGPPALVRCVTTDCEGRELAALTPDEWNTRAAVGGDGKKPVIQSPKIKSPARRYEGSKS